MIHIRKPKHESFHIALWNVASICGISSVIFKSTTIVVGTTTIATIWHVVALFFDEDII